jgi:hypothetical protein
MKFDVDDVPMFLLPRLEAIQPIYYNFIYISRSCFQVLSIIKCWARTIVSVAERGAGLLGLKATINFAICV